MLVNLITVQNACNRLHVFFCAQKRKEKSYATDKVSKINVCFNYCNYYSTMFCFLLFVLLIFIPIEFVLAYLSEIFIGSPLSVKLALKAIDPQKNDHMIVETAIICATVGIMCPLMSFFATILYNGIIGVAINGAPLNDFIINFIPYWLQKVVLNFPFALLSQLFFIQPLTRTIFRLIFERSKSKNEELELETELNNI